MLREDRNKELKGYKFIESEFRLSSRKKIVGLSMITLIGTALATAMGSGGGTIYSPMLLSLGLPVEVTRATALYLIMYKSLATVVQFAILGKVNWGYGIWFGIYAFFATVFISKSILRCVGKRQSVLVILIAVIIIISAVTAPYFAIRRMLSADGVSNLGYA